MDILLRQRVLAQLPQTQCGECGYPGCEPYAHAIVAEGEACNLCPPGGIRVWHKLAQLTTKREKFPPSPHTAHRVRIDQQTCIGCYKCVRVCPVDAIAGAPKRLHQVNLAVCTGCDLCVPVCPVDCIHPQVMPDVAEHYSDPQPLYQQRRNVWEQQRLELKKNTQTVNHVQPKHKQIKLTVTSSNRIIQMRLNQALQRARRSGDEAAGKRITRQLEQLTGK